MEYFEFGKTAFAIVGVCAFIYLVVRISMLKFGVPKLLIRLLDLKPIELALQDFLSALPSPSSIQTSNLLSSIFMRLTRIGVLTVAFAIGPAVLIAFQAYIMLQQNDVLHLQNQFLAWKERPYVSVGFDEEDLSVVDIYVYQAAAYVDSIKTTLTLYQGGVPNSRSNSARNILIIPIPNQPSERFRTIAAIQKPLPLSIGDSLAFSVTIDYKNLHSSSEDGLEPILFNYKQSFYFDAVLQRWQKAELEYD